MSSTHAAPRDPAFQPGRLVRLPFRLAWRQLRSERARLAAAIAGVMFACVLVFMQLGFRAALFESASRLLAAMNGELFLIHPLTVASFRPEPLPRARAWQCYAHQDVVKAVPVYLTQASWRNPETGARRMIQLIGLDLDAGVMDFPGLAPLIDPLKQPETMAFDRQSRPEFGPVPDLVAQHGPILVEIASREARVVGIVSIGASFGADGNALMSELNFLRYVPQRKASSIDLVALRLRAGADIPQVQAQLRAMLPPDVKVLTYPELVENELAYWREATPIGFIFAFGSFMGLVVGLVIVYQILFSDIAAHISEYATLKAMGYTNGYLSRVVMSAAFILAVLGFLPGLALSAMLYDMVGQATFLPLRMDFDRVTGVFTMIFSMCIGAGLLAVRKLRDANPADMF